MNFRQASEHEREAITDVFRASFGDAEGDAEGEIIGVLVRRLFETTPDSDILNYVAEDSGRIVGSIIFTRVRIGDSNNAFLLSPVAMATGQQGKGTGQALIRFGLEELIRQGATFALTYGDPAFYGKVGFEQISVEDVIPPYDLSQPIGWLGQSLDDRPLSATSGACGCVEAFNNPDLW